VDKTCRPFSIKDDREVKAKVPRKEKQQMKASRRATRKSIVGLAVIAGFPFTFLLFRLLQLF